MGITCQVNKAKISLGTPSSPPPLFKYIHENPSNIKISSSICNKSLNENENFRKIPFMSEAAKIRTLQSNF